MIPGAAFAQSTGSVDFENTDIVVTGSKVDKGVAGVESPNTSKAKAVLNSEFIRHQVPGQSINDVINQLPGVSSQNNDPFGSAGGKLFIRGFDNTRISETVDGIPLNDTGGYALYSNQQLDPELIDQVNVNLGSTDVDSPTASASGSTVNYRSITPTDDFHAQMMGSAGDFNFFRVFGLVNTGVFTSFGTKAWFSASTAKNDAIYGGIGKIDKKQFNGKIYQPIGDNGDFVSVAASYNENRNNFFGSVPLWTENYGARVVGGGSGNRFPLTDSERFYQTARCTGATNSVANTCGSDYEYRFNPSNTGNIRASSKFTLADGLVLTMDPSYQYTNANGGGTVVANEGTINVGGVPSVGYFGSTPYFGRDINGDGQIGTVRLLAPSNTVTNRLGLIASLRYDLNAHNTVRIAYSYDRGKHRQTGETGFIDNYGNAINVYPMQDGLTSSDGTVLQKRNRLSYAILHQVSGEYRGDFGNLTVNAGVRLPFFRRNLNNFCFATNAGGGVTCLGTDAENAAYAAANPSYAAPQHRTLDYNRALPSAGAVFNFTPQASVFVNYSKGMQVPGTDNLYNSFYFATDTDAANPKPETTDNFDAGLRFRSSKVQAQASAWYTIYTNRLASAYDRDTSTTIYRNLGRVDKYGVDASISYRPIDQFSLYAFGSYLKSKIKDNVDAGVNCTATLITQGQLGCTTVGAIGFYQTAGKRESGAPTFTVGGRAEVNWGPVLIGLQGKRTGPRYVNDQNLAVFQTVGTTFTEINSAKAPAYTLFDLDARVSLAWAGLNDSTYLQLNVSNLFDKVYVGGFDGTLSNTAITYAQIGSPRAFIGTLNVGF